MSDASGPLARWQDLVLDAEDPQVLAPFWAAVVGLQAESTEHGACLTGHATYQRIWVNGVDRPKTVKNRLHLDVYAGSIAELEVLGATVLARAEDTGFGWTLMADPEGGEFCAFLRDPERPVDDGGLPAYRLHGIGVDCVDPAAQAAWWGGLLGVTPTTYEGHDGLYTLEHATPDPVLTIDFAAVPEPRVGPNRVHWDVTGDAEAIIAAGATPLWDMPRWTVLADPEGNEFCVFPER
ncbi:VOC family protein [Nocardioides sp. GCM10027113]|uniref:VOC family protein n=1 Tax=unclassified Nocardioides TaxID=2615069 RepID=UPI003612E2C8